MADLGEIDFPHGDGVTYDHDMSCVYVITVSEGMVINMTFTEFHLEESGSCSYDWLTVPYAFAN